MGPGVPQGTLAEMTALSFLGGLLWKRLENEDGKRAWAAGAAA
jgi:hypothetical protein